LRGRADTVGEIIGGEMGDEIRPFERVSGVVKDIATRKAGTIFGVLFNHKHAR
jgi:hypothetical protein